MPRADRSQAAAFKRSQKRWRTLQDDEVDDLYKEVVRAKIAEIVRGSDIKARRSLDANTKSDGSTSTAPLDNESEITAWDWLDKRVRAQLKEAIDTKREDAFVLLTPQGYFDWWNALFQAVIAISVLGAGFTFTIIVGSLTPVNL